MTRRDVAIVFFVSIFWIINVAMIVPQSKTDKKKR
jgi:hypothetical protein